MYQEKSGNPAVTLHRITFAASLPFLGYEQKLTFVVNNKKIPLN
jgi:hypothetical protein